VAAALELELLVAVGRNQHTAVLNGACAVSQDRGKYGKVVVGQDGGT
jgi:hypothetical protein